MKKKILSILLMCLFFGLTTLTPKTVLAEEETVAADVLFEWKDNKNPALVGTEITVKYLLLVYYEGGEPVVYGGPQNLIVKKLTIGTDERITYNVPKQHEGKELRSIEPYFYHFGETFSRRFKPSLGYSKADKTNTVRLYQNMNSDVTVNIVGDEGVQEPADDILPTFTFKCADQWNDERKAEVSLANFYRESTIGLGDYRGLYSNYFTNDPDSIYRGLSGNRYSVWNMYTGDESDKYHMTATLSSEESFQITEQISGNANDGWKLTVAPIVRTLTFNAGDEAKDPVKTTTKKLVNNDILREAIADPNSDNYLFEGWYNGDIKWDPTQRVVADATYTAKWKAKQAPHNEGTPSVKKVTVPNTATK